MPSLIRKLRLYVTNKVESEYQSLITEQKELVEKIASKKDLLGSKEMKILVSRQIKNEYLLKKLELKVGKQNFEYLRNRFG